MLIKKDFSLESVRTKDMGVDLMEMPRSCSSTLVSVYFV